MKRVVLVVAIVLLLPPIVQAQEMEPRAWLPLINRGYFEPSATMTTEQAVIDVGATASVYLHGSACNVTSWDARIVWPLDADYLGGAYGDGFWSEWLRWDAIPFKGVNYIEVRQTAGLPSTERDAEMYRVDLSFDERGFYFVCADVAFDGTPLRHLACQWFNPQWCAFDYNHDGVRDLRDVNEIAKRYGCQQGDACYTLRYDADGNGVINERDAILAWSWWHVPCPEVP